MSRLHYQCVTFAGLTTPVVNLEDGHTLVFSSWEELAELTSTLRGALLMYRLITTKEKENEE